MTDEPSIPPGIIPEAKDLRRAAALLIAADPLAFNLPAVMDVLNEVKTTDQRVTPLITAMSVLAYQSPDLGTDDGQQALRNSWAHYRSIEQHRKDTTDE